MKASAVALLGLCFLLALISSTQAGGGGKGKGKRGKCEGMKMMDETDKAMWKDCGGKEMKKPDGGAEGTGGDEGGEGKKKHWENMKKVGKCMMEKQGIVAGGRLNVDKYTELMNKKFESSESANKASEAFKKCCEGLTDKDLTDEDMGKVGKCSMKSMWAGCKKKEKKEDES